MPRRKPATVLTLAPGQTAAATAELWAGIDLVLLSANNPQQIPAQIARELHLALMLLRDGANVRSARHWPLRAAVAFDNLSAVVRSGDYHLGRCRECENWFLATDARQGKCYRPECARADARKRAAAARRTERQRQKHARVTLKGTSRTK